MRTERQFVHVTTYIYKINNNERVRLCLKTSCHMGWYGTVIRGTKTFMEVQKYYNKSLVGEKSFYVSPLVIFISNKNFWCDGRA